MKKIIILGDSGGCLSIIELIRAINKNKKKYKILGFLDDKIKKIKGINNYKILGKFSDIKKFDAKISFATSIGSSKNFLQTEKKIKDLNLSKKRFPILIHPNSIVSKNSKIGYGTIIYENCSIGANVKIGDFVNILPNSVINHDCEIGNFSKINSMCNFAGSIKVGKSCYIGSGVNIRENLNIGQKNLIGMGSMVLKSFLKSNQKIFGFPAKIINKS